MATLVHNIRVGDSLKIGEAVITLTARTGRSAGLRISADRETPIVYLPAANEPEGRGGDSGRSVPEPRAGPRRP